MNFALSSWQAGLLRHGGLLGWLLAALLAVAAGLSLSRGLRLQLVPLFLATGLGIVVLLTWRRARRERLIREAPLPHYLKRRLRGAYPHLTQKDAELVERGLRQFFLACHRSRGKFVAMPSRAVDAMWHEFILHTQAYRDWCSLAMGRFLHHTPAEVLSSNALHNDGLRRAWYWSCKDEAIQPRGPTRLPLLFALDTKLEIPDGFRYQPDCGAPLANRRADGSTTHCATGFSDGSCSGDAGGFGGCESSSDGGDGGGDGGSGCGGGGGD